MNYVGNLYGKVGGMLFKTGQTTEDWDKMELRIKELEAENKMLKIANAFNEHKEREVCHCQIPNTTMELPHRCVKCNKPVKWD